MNARQKAEYEILTYYREKYERMITIVPDYGPWCVYQMGKLELMIDVRTNRQPLSEALPRLVA